MTKTKDVEISAVTATNTTGPWKVIHDGNSSAQSASYPAVVLPQYDGPYAITFKITGDPNVTFSNDPIWVQAGNKPKMHVIDSQITVHPGAAGTRELTITDANSNTPTQPPLKLYYRLNFNGDLPHRKLDPIILNGGGVKPQFELSLVQVTELAFAAFVAFFLARVAYRLLFRR